MKKILLLLLLCSFKTSFAEKYSNLILADSVKHAFSEYETKIDYLNDEIISCKKELLVSDNRLFATNIIALFLSIFIIVNFLISLYKR